MAGRFRTASMSPWTLFESALYSPLLPPVPGLIGVTFPFFVMVSAMGVLISLVAIPLRENAPNIFSRSRLEGTTKRARQASIGNAVSHIETRLKSLKFLILRVSLLLKSLYHKQRIWKPA